MENPEDLIIAAARVAEDVKIAAKVVSEAVLTAEMVREKASKDAAQLLLDAKEKNTEKISNALREVFGEQEESQRFIDTKRIPLICKDISNINKSLEEIHRKLDTNFISKDQFWPVKTIVYGGVAIILSTVLGWILFNVHTVVK